jgi:putative ABC transport system permease protein
VLAPEVNSEILVGFPAAQKYLSFDGHPSEIYVRTVNTQAAATRVDNLLGAQANPENPSDVDVAQPSDVLTAQADTAGAFDDLFLGLGAVALLVGAVGVANIMVISVLERRQEIGLRRALGATRGQIRIQFLAEAILLSLAGGVVGVAAGVVATTVYAHAHDEAIVIPPDAWAGGLAATLQRAALGAFWARPIASKVNKPLGLQIDCYAWRSRSCRASRGPRRTAVRALLRCHG